MLIWFPSGTAIINNIRDLNVFALILPIKLNMYFKCELLWASCFFNFIIFFFSIYSPGSFPALVAREALTVTFQEL